MNDSPTYMLDQALIAVLVKRIAALTERGEIDRALEDFSHLERLEARTPTGQIDEAVAVLLPRLPPGDPRRATLTQEVEKLKVTRQALALTRARKGAVANAIANPALRPYDKTVWAVPELALSDTGTLTPMSGWPFEPLYAGAWQAVRQPEEATALMARAGLALGGDPFFESSLERRILALRIARPRCYRDVVLAEVLLGDLRTGLAATPCSALILLSPDGATFLAGTSPTLHAYNAVPGRLHLDSAEEAEDYLRFFCGAVHGEEGPFTLTDNEAQLRARVKPGRAAPGQIPAVPALKLKRMLHAADADDPVLWEAIAGVHYAYALFSARFVIHRSGMIEMPEDEPIWTGEGMLWQPRFRSGLRLLSEDESPKDQPAGDGGARA